MLRNFGLRIMQRYCSSVPSDGIDKDKDWVATDAVRMRERLKAAYSEAYDAAQAGAYEPTVPGLQAEQYVTIAMLIRETERVVERSE